MTLSSGDHKSNKRNGGLNQGLRADVDDMPGIIIKLILRLKKYG